MGGGGHCFPRGLDKNGTGGVPSISYYDFTNHSLRYANFTGKTWVIQTVDPNCNSLEYTEGSDTSLAIDSQGHPHIAYCTTTNGQIPTAVVKYAEWNGSVWSLITIDAGNSHSLDLIYGFPSLALDSFGYPHITYIGRHPGDNNICVEHAYWDGFTWNYQNIDYSHGTYQPTSVPHTSLKIDKQDIPHVAYLVNGAFNPLNSIIISGYT